MYSFWGRTSADYTNQEKNPPHFSTHTPSLIKGHLRPNSIIFLLHNFPLSAEERTSALFPHGGVSRYVSASSILGYFLSHRSRAHPSNLSESSTSIWPGEQRLELLCPGQKSELTLSRSLSVSLINGKLGTFPLAEASLVQPSRFSSSLTSTLVLLRDE